jgi:hypothetical protein
MCSIAAALECTSIETSTGREGQIADLLHHFGDIPALYLLDRASTKGPKWLVFPFRQAVCFVLALPSY